MINSDSVKQFTAILIDLWTTFYKLLSTSRNNINMLID